MQRKDKLMGRQEKIKVATSGNLLSTDNVFLIQAKACSTQYKSDAWSIALKNNTFRFRSYRQELTEDTATQWGKT